MRTTTSTRPRMAWTTWFFDVAWDETMFLVDRRRFEVTAMCMTDTD